MLFGSIPATVWKPPLTTYAKRREGWTETATGISPTGALLVAAPSAPVARSMRKLETSGPLADEVNAYTMRGRLAA